MLKVTKISGMEWSVSVSVPAEDTDGSCYFTGDFSCNGDGAVTLYRNGEEWTGDILLTSGVYEYYLEINQFIRIDENRKPLSGKKKIVLLQEEPAHIHDDERFHSRSADLEVVRCACSPDTEIVLADTDIINGLSPTSIYGNEAVRIFEFVIPVRSRQYSFTLPDEGTQLGPFPSGDVEVDPVPPNVIYQIFPDRFCRNGSTVEGLAEWGEIPGSISFYGGNLKGISSRIGYLRELGVNHVYLTPFFKSQSNHRYDVDDYFSVDPLLGTNQDLKDLSDELRSLGISMIVDVVFNHTSVHFHAFRNAISRPEGAFSEWYKFLSLRPEPYSGKFIFKDGSSMPDYETFQGYGGMPKLNHRNPEVQELMLDVLKYYGRELNVSHFRYDVSDSIDLKVLSGILPEVRKEFPEIGHIAEIWCLSTIFFSEGLYDSSMNYPLREMIIRLVEGKLSADEFNAGFVRIKATLGERRIRKMMNLLGSHDTPRISTILGSKNAALLAYAILFLQDGMPTIYYGDEVGMEGGPDPDCRRTFPWNSMDEELLKKFRSIVNIRKRFEVARNGYPELWALNEGFFEFRKRSSKMCLTLKFSLCGSQEPGSLSSVVFSSGVSEKNGILDYEKFGFEINVEMTGD